MSQSDKNLIKAVIFIAFILWGVWTMKQNRFKYYGLIGGDLQIKAQIKMACLVINPNNAEESELLLAELIAVESNNGRTTDYSEEHGEGLTQFDFGTFEEIKKYFLQDKFNDLRDKIKTFCLVDIKTLQYHELRLSPMASIIMARLLFYKYPEPIPNTKEERWELYKKRFNSELGATTKDKYYIASNNAVFKASEVT